MISYFLLEVVSQALRHALNDSNPFGNCTVLFFGDFGQLGPVVRENTPIPYIWDAATTDYLDLFRIDLQQSIRQKDDAKFMTFLNILREYDDNSIEHREILNQFLWAHQWKHEDDPRQYHFLFSRTTKTEEMNIQCLQQIHNQEFVFDAIDNLGGVSTEAQKRQTELQTGLPTRLRLRVGCRVMCICNIYYEAGVVNGSLGFVTHIQQGNLGTLDSIVQVGFDNGQRSFAGLGVEDSVLEHIDIRREDQWKAEKRQGIPGRHPQQGVQNNVYDNALLEEHFIEPENEDEFLLEFIDDDIILDISDDDD
ncbi:hypothetical protein BGZ80_006739 [Entomortierella chlamydospora]|uniref:DNA helicase Pif1-like 2B domain-containing protein n=1 Tax=Entomortierella chlamydospora TaxID=101097 RepID=A0A9P6MH26_9FUNG|nr:hypothetical protein BGZ80_006739 [Entomortierella chlamydospora]